MRLSPLVAVIGPSLTAILRHVAAEELRGAARRAGLLIQGRHVLLCRMPDGETAGVGHCAEAADAPGPRQLR